MTGIPVVRHDVFIHACADLLRPLAEDSEADPLGDDLARLDRENPELMRAVAWFADGLMDVRQELAVAVFTCRMLRAQAEVEELERMAGGGAPEGKSQKPKGKRQKWFGWW